MSMRTMDDRELLQAYAESRSEAAFAELVHRHLNWVYSAAWRQVGDAHLAEDVTQSVFSLLALKAGSLASNRNIPGWLFNTTRFVAIRALRAETRRRHREQNAFIMTTITNDPSDEDETQWARLAPCLDQAVAALSDLDRSAVLLRFYQKLSLEDVGRRLGVSEDAAKKRVSRAVDKMKEYLVRRGVTLGVTTLASFLTIRTVQAAPTTVAATVLKVSLAAGSAPTLVPELARQTLNAWRWLKTKWLVGMAAIVVAVFVLPQLNPRVSSPADILSANEPSNVAPVAPDDSQAITPGVNQVSPSLSIASNKMVLHFVAADSGQPIPLATFEYVLLESTNVSRQQFRANRFGVREIPVPRSTVTRLFLWTKIDGFADTWLHWQSDRGDKIPGEYTVRLARAVQIGGLVVDAAGQPVAGAHVSFGNGPMESVLSNARPEAHVVAGMEAAPTDSAGRWTLSRIAPEVFNGIRGQAVHSEHVRAGVSISSDPVAEKQLLAGTYVFQMGRAVTLDGVVLDTDNRPVSGATLLIQGTPTRDQRFTTNQVDGTFNISGCAPGLNKVIVDATGFIQARLNVNGETNPPPLRIILQRGKTLSILVVNQSGAPVANAEVEIAGSESDIRTDVDGRLQWGKAPTENLTLQVRASGYMSAEDIAVKANGQEHLIKLSPALTISGTVRDAATGQPVPHFRIVSGRPLVSRLTQVTNFQWQSGGQDLWISSDKGEFRKSISEATRQDPARAFRFDADGYAPFVTRGVRYDEGEVRIEVTLRQAKPLAVTVRLPDGNVAVKADVGLIVPGAQIRLRPGGLSRGNIYPVGESVPTTDDQGRFILPPDDDMAAVIVANQIGYAESTRAALVAEPVIRLQPWGRIEGTILSGGRGAPGRIAQFQYGSNPNLRDTVFADLDAYRTTTDDDGRFVFSKVPPGKHRVAQLMPQNSTVGRGMMTGRFQPGVEVEVRSGQTTVLTFGGSNCAVTAHIRWPPQLKRDPNLRVGLSLQPPPILPPAEFQNDREAVARWRVQPEVAAALAARRGFPVRFIEAADGTFLAENVPPGSYELSATIFEPSVGGKPPTTRARARVSVTIPANPPTGTFDVGEIALQPVE